MTEKSFIRADEVAEELDVSKSYAYKVIKQLNDELSAKGYLADIEQQAQQLFLRLVKQMAEREGVTEKLKADNQMAWVARMNDIRSRATEVVNTDLIYT